MYLFEDLLTCVMNFISRNYIYYRTHEAKGEFYRAIVKSV